MPLITLSPEKLELCARRQLGCLDIFHAGPYNYETLHQV